MNEPADHPRYTSLGECYYTAEDAEGWCYARLPFLEGDQRALVSLKDSGGMEWVGIRVWHARDKRWFNGNEPETQAVLAWQPIPQTARRHWYRGQLIPEPQRCRCGGMIRQPLMGSPICGSCGQAA